MNNKQILSIAMKQSAIDIGCKAEDFGKTTNIVVPFKLGDNAKNIIPNPLVVILFHMEIT